MCSIDWNTQKCKRNSAKAVISKERVAWDNIFTIWNDPSPTCICSHMLSVHYLAISSFYWYIYGSTYTYLPTYIYLHLFSIYRHLPTSTDTCLHLPASTYIYLHLPTSTYIYLHLPTSTYIYLHLPTSTDIYLHLPTSTYIYLPTYRGHSQPMVRILGWRLALRNIEFTHLRNSRCWQRKMEPLCVGCPQWRCSLGSTRGHHGLSNKDVSIPTECSNHLSSSVWLYESQPQQSSQHSAAEHQLLLLFLHLLKLLRMVFWIWPIGQRLLQGLRKKTAWCPENPKPGW